MKDDLNITCGDIRKKLKAFLDDLLAEDEYQAFVAHIDGCGECKDYVRKIGSISNQLWELGEVKVPQDLNSTILFRLKQAEGENRKSKSVILKKSGIGILIAILTVPLIFLGVYRLKSHREPREADEPPIVTTIIERRSTMDDNRAELLLMKLKKIEEALRSPKEKGPVEENSRERPTIEAPASAEKPLTSTDSLDVTGAQITGPRPLHWHLAYSEDAGKAKLLNMFSALGIGFDHQDADLLVFNATGEKLDRLLEQILFVFKERGPLYNYSAGVTTFPDRESRVSAYLEEKAGKGFDGLHWHISYAAGQKPRLLDIIREMSISIDYELEELILFSISKTEIAKLRSRIEAMGVTAGVVFSEFGYPKSKEGRLVSRPVKVSIYFSKR